MRILFISGFVPYPPVSGNLQRNFNLIREIARDHQVDLITLTQRGLHSDRKTLDDAISELRKYCGKISVYKIATDYCAVRWYFYLFANLFSRTPLTVWKFHSSEMRDEIVRTVKEKKYDLVHIDSSDVASYLTFTGGIPAVLNHHNVESSLLLRRAVNSSNPLKKLYLHLQGKKLRNYERAILYKYKFNLAVSENDALELKQICPEAKIEIISNGTDTEYFVPRPGQEEKRLIFAGPLSWYPNGDAMIYMCREIYPLLRKSHTDLHLDIIGHSAPSALRELAGKDNSIHLHGFQRDIREYMAKASVYVVPIRVGGGTRLKILDALASGKAVVSTRVGCEGLDVRDGEDILIADNPRDFAMAMERLLNDPALREKLGRNGRSLAEKKYSWQTIGAYLKEIYKKTVSRFP